MLCASPPPSEVSFLPFLRPPRPIAAPAAPEPRSARELAPGLVACGPGLDEVGVSAVLTGGSSFPAALQCFVGYGGVEGTGVHLGDGYVLTARHVADVWRRPQAWTRRRASSRRERFDAFRPGWTVRYVPAPGSFRGGPRVASQPADAGRCRDWALLHGPEVAQAPSLLLGRTSTLAPGERVWLVGDHTGSAYRVTSAVFSARDGANAWLTGCEVDTGFSGSPAIDVAGRVIGIVVAMMAGGRCLLVAADGVLERLASARRFNRSLPLLATR